MCRSLTPQDCGAKVIATCPPHLGNSDAIARCKGIGGGLGECHGIVCGTGRQVAAPYTSQSVMTVMTAD